MYKVYKRIGFVVYFVVLILTATSLQATSSDPKTGIDQVTIEQVKKDYGLPSATVASLVRSLKILPLLEQAIRFDELAIQLHEFTSTTGVTSRVKVALNQGDFNLAAEALVKPDRTATSELANYYYQRSVIEGFKQENTGAFQLIKKALQLDGENSRYQRQIAQLLLNQKKARLAIPYLEKALQLDLAKSEAYSANLANDHRLLGIAWYGLAKGGKAAEHFQQSVALSQSLHKVQLANASYSLALVLQSLGNTETAIDHYTSALKIYKQSLGNEHPKVANTLFQLATAWKVLGEEKKSIKLLKQSLELSRETYGESSLLFAQKLNSVGEIFRLLDQHEVAIKLHQQALQIHTTNRSLPRVVTKDYAFLGSAYLANNDVSQAISYYEKSLKLEHQIYSKAHPMLALRYGNLGSAWLKKGNTDKALDNYEQALLITRQNYGDKHHEVASILRNMGITWQVKGDYQQAVKYFKQALSTEQAVFGEKSPRVTRHMNELGTALNQLGKSKKAEDYHQQALDIDQKAYGRQHATVARDYSNLGSAIAKQGKTNEALQLHQKALAIDLAVSGGSHPNTARDLSKLGAGYKQLGKLKESVSHQEKALRIDRITLGEEHQNIAIQENNLGVDYYSLGEDKKAKQHLNKAVRLAGEKHPKLHKIEHNMNKFKADNKLESKTSLAP